MNGVDISNDMEGMVNQYLGELARALQRLSTVRRDQLIGDIREHIIQLRLERPPVDRSDMEALLNRVGLPEDIAEVALEDFDGVDPEPTGTAPVTMPAAPPVSLWRRPGRKAVLLTAACVVVIGLLSVIALRSGPSGIGFFGRSAMAIPTHQSVRIIPPPAFGSRDITEPDVVGMSQSQAQAALTASGVNVVFGFTPSDTVAIGHVISQTPSAGTVFLRQLTVKVTVSDGPTS
jgi:hypothetical protein